MEKDCCIKQISYRRDLIDEYSSKLQKLEKEERAYKILIKICKAQIKSLEDKFYGL